MRVLFAVVQMPVIWATLGADSKPTVPELPGLRS